MAAWRILGSGVLALIVCPLAAAQTYPLVETARAGDCFQVQIDMTLTGEIRVNRGGGPISMKRTASAHHQFSERVLAANPEGVVQKAARFYETAKLTLAVNDLPTERALRTERRLLIAQRPKDQLFVYCPTGPLTAEELELTAEHFDTLAIVGLLPAKSVAIGDTWKPGNVTVQQLCGFEGLTTHDLQCKLEEVRDHLAKVTVAGSATGIELGALAKLKIDASCQFDLATHRITAVEWKQHDDRDQGPASPATNIDTVTTVKRSPMEQPQSLSDVALISVPDGFDVPGTMSQLAYHDARNRYDLIYAREWQIVAQTDDHVVMRLLDHGDFVAQVTITPWTRARSGEHMTPEAFQQAMAGTPGWEQGDVLQVGEVPTEAGRWIYRVSALGKMDGMKLLQNFYLVASPSGEQVVLAFTMTQAQAEKLGTRDLSLVGSLDFPPKPK
jgi:hypothetical protein